MSHYFYITPEEYAEAAKNGVDENRLEVRIRQYGWSKERAINEPMREYRDRRRWAKIAESNGISYQTFMSRINIMGMSEEVAATKPLQDKRKAVKHMADRKRQIPLELRALAESNGIAYPTLRARLKTGMDPHEAATKPLMTKKEIGVMGARRYEEKHGRFQDLIFKKETLTRKEQPK